MRWRVQISQPESRPSGTERYLRVVHPAVRGCRGIVAAVAVFSAAGAIGGRTNSSAAHPDADTPTHDGTAVHCAVGHPHAGPSVYPR